MPVTYISDTQRQVTTSPAKPGATDVVVTDTNAQLTHGTFTYTPAVFTQTSANQTFVVPAGVTTLYLQTWGAGGGMGQDPSVVGGAGGYASGHFTVTPGDTATIVVGVGGMQVTSPTQAGAGGGASGVFLGVPGTGQRCSSLAAAVVRTHHREATEAVNSGVMAQRRTVAQDVEATREQEESVAASRARSAARTAPRWKAEAVAFRHFRLLG